MTENCLVLTGGPGTGKTTTVNAILQLLEHQADRVALCAPTGRAAKRLSELTGRKALPSTACWRWTTPAVWSALSTMTRTCSNAMWSFWMR